jgi:hypothetical protein
MKYRWLLSAFDADGEVVSAVGVPTLRQAMSIAGHWEQAAQGQRLERRAVIEAKLAEMDRQAEA